MSIRRQCYEWRNVGETNHFQITPLGVQVNDCDDVVLNRYPISAINFDLGKASEKIFWKLVQIAPNQVVDIFNGGIGNNLDIPGQLKAYQFIVLDGIAVYPQFFNAQIIVNTTRYFQDPDGVPSRLGGISGRVVPYPQGAIATKTSSAKADLAVVNLQNILKNGLQPPIIIKPGDRWAVEVKNNSDSFFPASNRLGRGGDIVVARCFIKYLLIDGADCIVAQKLIDAGWPLTVENLWRYKQDIIKSHLYASMAELPEAISEARRKV